MMELQEVGWGAWTALLCLRIGQVAGSCECGNEPPGFIKLREILRLAEELLDTKVSSPWS